MADTSGIGARGRRDEGEERDWRDTLNQGCESPGAWPVVPSLGWRTHAYLESRVGSPNEFLLAFRTLYL